MRCLFRLGCLMVIAVLAVVAWFTRDRWLPRLTGAPPVERTTAVERWEPLTSAGSARTRAALQSLASGQGQVFQSLRAADIAAYAIDSAGGLKGGIVDSVQAGVFGDRVRIRGVVRTADLGGVLGAFSALLKEREPIEFAGTMRVVRPGLGELTVLEARIRDLPIPVSALPTVLKQVIRGPRPAGISETGLPIPLPTYIGDIRVANGRVTLYKSTP
jgi:hypothetical protein